MKIHDLWKSMAYENSWPWKSMAYENSWPWKSILWESMAYENLWPMKIHGLWKFVAYENSWPIKIHGLYKLIASDNSLPKSMKICGLRNIMAYVNSQPFKIHGLLKFNWPIWNSLSPMKMDRCSKTINRLFCFYEWKIHIKKDNSHHEIKMFILLAFVFHQYICKFLIFPQQSIKLL